MIFALFLKVTKTDWKQRLSCTYKFFTSYSIIWR